MKSVHFVAVLAVVLFGVACGPTSDTQVADTTDTVSAADVSNAEAASALPDVSGHYKLPQESGDLELIVTKEGSTYRYNLKGDGGKLDAYGTLLIQQESTDWYLTFDGPIEQHEPKSIQALYRDGMITIQNSGNADQGSWELFPYCGAKYLEFSKI